MQTKELTKRMPFHTEELTKKMHCLITLKSLVLGLLIY